MRAVTLPKPDTWAEEVYRMVREQRNQPYLIPLPAGDIIHRFTTCVARRKGFALPLDVMLWVAPHIGGLAYQPQSSKCGYLFEHHTVAITTTALKVLPASSCAVVLAHEVGHILEPDGLNHHEREYHADEFADTILPRRHCLRALTKARGHQTIDITSETHPSIKDRVQRLMRNFEPSHAF